jgi:hypothetical protein
LIGGEIARALGMKMPELVFNLDEAFGRTEADEEIQDLLQVKDESRTALPFWRLIGPSCHGCRPSYGITNCGWTRISLMSTVLSEHQYVDLQQELWLRSRGSLYFHHSWTNWEKACPKSFCLNQRPRIVAASVSAG